MFENTKIWAETYSSLNIWSWIERVCLNDKNSESATEADNNWSHHWVHHLKWVCYNDKSIVNLLIELVIRRQALLHACSRHERNKLYYMHVVDVNRTSSIECDKSESEVSLLQWHSTRRNRLETFNEMSLKRFMSRRELEMLYVKKRAWNALCQEKSLKRFMLRRNRLETSDEMSLKCLMKWV